MTIPWKTIRSGMTVVCIVLMGLCLSMCGEKKSAETEPAAEEEVAEPVEEELTREEERALKEEFTLKADEEIDEENAENELAKLEKEIEEDKE